VSSAPSEGRDPVLEARHVSFSAGGRQILRDVSLEVGGSETVALLGPSGCGKTTLLRVIAGLERPDAGHILFEGRDVTGVPPHRRGFGMMFQDFALFPHLSVAGNVGFGLRHSGLGGRNRAERVEELLALVGLSGFGTRSVDTLSGGERQRVALARTLAPGPRLLMLDEPLGSLDRALRERLLVELKGILRQLGVPTVYVTHDQGEAFAVAAHVAIMDDGRIVRVGTPRDIYADPRTVFVANYLGMRNVVPATVRDGMAVSAAGRWPAPPGAVAAESILLLLRDDGVRVAESEGDCTVGGRLLARLFQGPRTAVQVETAAGVLAFEVEGEQDLPPEGAMVRLLVPQVQIIEDGRSSIAR
jgi:thiamine transport system ATP-binding protein